MTTELKVGQKELIQNLLYEATWARFACKWYDEEEFRYELGLKMRIMSLLK